MHGGRRDNLGFYLLIAWVATMLTGGFVFATLREGEDFLIPALVIGGIVTAVLLRSSLGKALAERIRGDGVVVGGLSEADAAELDEMRARLLELEERVDFAERLLARQREPEQLGAGEAPA